MMKLVGMCLVLVTGVLAGCATEVEAPPSDPAPAVDEKTKNEKDDALPAVQSNETHPARKNLCEIDQCPPGYGCLVGRCVRLDQSPDF